MPRDELVQFMETNLRRECQQFVEQYVLGFRREVAEFCDQVIAQKGQVHGKTLNAIRDRTDRFHAMNVFGDGDAAGQAVTAQGADRRADGAGSGSAARRGRQVEPGLPGRSGTKY